MTVGGEVWDRLVDWYCTC